MMYNSKIAKSIQKTTSAYKIKQDLYKTLSFEYLFGIMHI